MDRRRVFALAALALAPLAGAGSASVAAPSATLAHGIDVSQYDGALDWSKIAASGVTFAIARVSDGLNYPDPYFAKNWSGMKANGVIRGVYQFFRPEQSAVAQADLLLKATTFEPGDLPPFLDFEVTDNQSAATMTAGIAAWCREIQSRTGLTPLIYTSHRVWTGIGVSAPAGVQLWVSNWGVASPAMPSAWSDWTFWQYTNTSTAPGAPNADSDVFNGTVAQLQAFAASHGTATVGGGSSGGSTGASSAGGSQPIVREGSTGSAVVALQQDLDRAGYAVTTDGTFGPATLAAVKAFQAANGLVADGIVGPLTWAALASATATSSRSTLREGATGSEVVTLQRALATAGFSPGAQDGDFGPATLAAVEAFQAAKGLTVDGVVGPATWAALP
ncbi:MAG TPA: GH25 family lysozyme [Planctomycetota bacterium]|nr:GH25 family lysozyme [Planctomycetota bacterium]